MEKKVKLFDKKITSISSIVVLAAYILLKDVCKWPKISAKEVHV